MAERQQQKITKCIYRKHTHISWLSVRLTFANDIKHDIHTCTFVQSTMM